MAQLLFTSWALTFCAGILANVFWTCDCHENPGYVTGFRQVPVVDSNVVESLKISRTLSLIYYYTSEDFSAKINFIQAFENSAKYLEAYDIALAVVNCATSDGEEKCKGEDAGTDVITYRNGKELIKLKLETMFDVNSLMSNALQLLLLEEVPIIDSQSERESLQSYVLGRQDLIFLYTQAIGTLEHRVFMEIAYTYQDRYKFAISTKWETTPGLQDSDKPPANPKFSMWTLHCAKKSVESLDDKSCRSVLYRGILTLSTLADYMKRLPEPNLFYAPENGTSSLFEMESDLPVIFIYSNHQMKSHSDDISDALAYDVRGFAKIVVVNVDDEACRALAVAQGFDGHVPQAAVVVPGGNHTFMVNKEELNLSDIRHFLITVATVPTKPGEEVVNAKDLSVSSVHDELIRAVETQDDEVANAVMENGNKQPEITHLTSVLKATFPDIIQNAHLKMVLYYLPYDPVSLTHLSDFEEAAKILASTSSSPELLARVNCFDASDLCGRENVTTYPVVRIHRRNMPFQLYEGAMDTLSVVRSVSLLSHRFPLMIETEDELNRFMIGDFPTKTAELSPSSVLFLARPEDKDTWTIYKAASRHLAPFVAMADVQENLVNLVANKYQSSVPCVVSIHHSDKLRPVRIMSNITDVNAVIDFVKQSMIPTMSELTAANFPTLRARNLPFVILFLNQSDPKAGHVRSAITKIASKEEVKHSIFCWMDVQNGTTGRQLLFDYTGAILLPSVVVVDHKEASVFVHQADTLLTSQIYQWLINVISGKEAPTKKLEENKWSPPGPYYDFLTMIDNEQQELESEEEEGQNLNTAVKVGLEKEEEVREKLMARHRGHIGAVPGLSEDGDQPSLETTKPNNMDSTHDPGEL